MSTDYTITDTGLLVPTDTEDTTDMQPMRWTPDARLETDPHGIPPVPTTDNTEAEQRRSPARAVRDWRRSNRRNRQSGLTRRVWKTEAGAEEQKRLSAVESKTVIRASTRNSTAAKLETLANDPTAEAYSNRRVRFWLLLMAAVGIALGVAISSSTAQTTITTFMGWEPGTFAALAAYGADPALGLVLFATLGARIVASARGVAIPDNARQALNRIEIVLFGLVALLNCGPSLGALLADVAGFQWGQIGPDFMVLVIHLLGPTLVATGVFGVPYMAVILSEISAATAAKQNPATGGVTPPPYRENDGAAQAAGNPSREDEITGAVLELAASGEWTRPVSAKRIREHFGCGTDIASAVRDRVNTSA